MTCAHLEALYARAEKAEAALAESRAREALLVAVVGWAKEASAILYEGNHHSKNAPNDGHWIGAAYYGAGKCPACQLCAALAALEGK